MNLVRYIASLVSFNGNFCVVGIDGPTASGKTTLADALAVDLKRNGIPSFIFRLDWTLTDRETRLLQLNTYITNHKAFEHEADLHMNLSLAQAFLGSVENLRFSNFRQKNIVLEGLYNRDDNGKCTGSTVASLTSKMVVIVEGHYTHHPYLRRYFDMNFLLLANTSELLRRKTNRVASYRDASTVADYFNWVDLPSFRHYYRQNFVYFKNVYRNEQFDAQQKLKHQEIIKLIFEAEKPEPGQSNIKNEFSKLLELIKSNHDRFIQLWGIHPQYRKKGFTETLKTMLKPSGFSLCFCNVFTNSSNTFSYHFGLENNDNKLLVSASLRKIQIVFQNGLTQNLFELKCDSNAYARKSHFFEVETIHEWDGTQYLIAPNRFFVPCFFQNFKPFQLILYHNHENVFDDLPQLFKKPCLLVVRSLCDDESDFITIILSAAGYKIRKINRYIFADNLNEKSLHSAFDAFCNVYTDDRSMFRANKPNDDELIELEKFGCKYSDNRFYFNEKTEYSHLAKMYPSLSQSCKTILSECIAEIVRGIEITDGVNADAYVNSLPVCLKEFYFALSVSKSGAVPFISMYDLNVPSADMQTYFDYFSENSTPFGIQASLNALGTEQNAGYLNICGPQSMAKSVRQNLLDFLRKYPNQKLPLWCLGVDHAVFNISKVSESIGFVEEASETQWIKSFCIDVSGMLSNIDESENFDAVKKSISNILSFDAIKHSDIEFYVGDEKLFESLPLPNALSFYKKLAGLFYDVAESQGYELNFLFGPFLGTLHHQTHNRLNPEISEMVFKNCSVYGFVGNVLHGTSFTPYGSIQKLIEKNCVRVNFAGKFLFAFVNGLPPDVRKKMGTSQTELKTAIAKLNHTLVETSISSIGESLKTELKLISDAGIGCSMEVNEIEWFRKGNFKLPDSDFSILMHKLADEINKSSPSACNAVFLASMIEVPFDVFSSGLVTKIINSGIKHFHIDLGDGEYISRKLDGYEKLMYLQKYHPEINTHLHLMVSNPFNGNGESSYLSKLASVKKSLIYLHPEAYDSTLSWKYGAAEILSHDCVPGIVLTVDEKLLPDVFLEKMRQAGLHHVLVMGVPIGRGGQTFKPETISKINYISEWAVKNKYDILIEIDGGLSDAVIGDCMTAGATYLSGWSLFLKYGVENIEERIQELLHAKN